MAWHEIAIVVAACVAALNGLSSAQLAANHPVSGGTYEYGYRWLTPSLGFTAGWMFLCAKSASAAAAAHAAPLEVLAASFDIPYVPELVAIGAVTAMAGVLLNLILGLSRVIFAMARRGDLPRCFASISMSNATPAAAVITTGILIVALTLVGNVKTTWSWSAFTVLVYYALTNLAAIQLTDSERLCPRAIPWLGLVTCLSLAFWVEFRIWALGVGFISGSLGLRWLFQVVVTNGAAEFPTGRR